MNSILSSAVVAGVLVAGGAAAAPAPKPARASAVALGQARGTLKVRGKSFTLAHAVAMMDKKEKSVLLLLTDEKLPVENPDFQLTPYRMDHPFHGVAFQYNATGQLTASYLYFDEFREGLSGYFDVTLQGPGGKTMAGTVRSTPYAAKSDEALSLDGAFNASVK